MIHDVMVAMTHTEFDAAALQAGVELARVHSAHLSVVLPLDLPLKAATRFGTGSSILDSDPVDVLRERQAERVRELRAELDGEGVSYEVRVAEGLVASAEAILALEARYADLVIMGGGGGKGADAAVARGIFATLLFQSGRPVLVVPQGWAPHFPVTRAVVGWRPTPECARAVHDAIGLLRGSERVCLAVVEPVSGERQHGDEPGADVAQHLARHTLDVEVIVQRSARGSVATELLLQVAETGAQLLVVGGYGHSRAREWAFGGTTRELLLQATVPILFSH